MAAKKQRRHRATFRDVLAWRFQTEALDYCAPVVTTPTLLVRFMIEPIGAARQTRRDVYAPSPAVIRYRAFQNALSKTVLDDLDGARYILSDLLGPVGLRFYFPIPESWSNRKKLLLAGAPQGSPPDFDNCAKAFYDSLFEKDCRVWDVRIQKFWAPPGVAPCIEVWRMPEWQ